MAVVQRKTVEVCLFTGECLRDVSNAVRQWNWRRCNLEESSRRRQPLAVAVEFFAFLQSEYSMIGTRLSSNALRLSAMN